MSRKRRDRPTRHHVIPSSKGGSNREENICWVSNEKHQLYHRMFGNMTPDEILEDLVVNYWNGQWYWLLRAINERREQ